MNLTGFFLKKTIKNILVSTVIFYLCSATFDFKGQKTGMNREEILNQIAHLFMRYGIKSITMDTIANELRISKKTLYEIFENKHEIVKTVVSTHIENEKRLMEEIIKNSENAIETMINMSKSIIDIYSKLRPTVLYDLKRFYPDVWQLAEDFNNNYTREMIKDNLVQGIEEGLYRQDIEPEILSTLYTIQLKVFSDETEARLEKYDFNKLLIQFFEYHLYGIMSYKGVKYFLSKEKNINI